MLHSKGNQMKMPGQDAAGSNINNSNSQKKRQAIIKANYRSTVLLNSLKIHLCGKSCVSSFHSAKEGDKKVM